MKKRLLFFFVGLVCSLVAMGATHTVSFNGEDVQSTSNYFTFAGNHNFNAKYIGVYGGTTYTSGLKMEGNSVISFTTTGNVTLTIAQSLSSNDTKYPKVSTGSTLVFTGSATNRVDDKANNVGVYTVSLGAGTHSITRTGEWGVLFLQVDEEDASKVNKPTINPTMGASYGDPTKITISSSTSGASIYYTTNGENPSKSSTLYTAPFTVTSNCTVKAIAVKSGMEDSDIATLNVTINNQRKIAYDFSAFTLTKGTSLAGVTVEDGSSFKLPLGHMYYIEGKSQTGWIDSNNNKYSLGQTLTIDKDFTLSPVFVDNTFELGDEEVTVNWTFATKDGAPSVGLEGNVGYYAVAAGDGEKVMDVVMTVNTTQDAGISGSKGKWNTTGADNRAQVNKGTVFTIPAMKGMVVTYTATNGNPTTESASFAGENGTVDGQSLVYTYNGTEPTIDIIDNGSNLYPSGIKVQYPKSVVAQDDATLKAMTVNGNKVNSFVPETTEYNYGLNFGTTSAPVMTATPNVDGADVQITQATSANGTATIVVTALDGTTKKTYTVNFYVKDGEATFKTTGTGADDDEVKNLDNEVEAAVIPGKYIAGIYDGTKGLKLRSNTGTDNTTLGLAINVKKGYVVKNVVLGDIYAQGVVAISNVFVDGKAIEWTSVDLPTASGDKQNIEIPNIEAKNSIELEFTTSAKPQYRAAITISYNTTDDIYVKVNKDVKYATFYDESERKLAEGMTAYTAEYHPVTSSIGLVELTGDVIPAKTAVIIEGASGALALSNTGATFTGTNDLKGTATDIATSSFADYTVFVLGYENSKVGFYKYEGTLAANKAFFLIQNASSAKINIIKGDDNVTGISNIKTQAKKGVMYNIAGQRVNANAKGLVIVNGKVVNMK